MKSIRLVSKWLPSLLMCSIGLLCSARPAGASGGPDLAEIELEKAIVFESLPPHVQDAIRNYTRGSGGLTSDLQRLSNTKNNLLDKLLSCSEDKIPQLIGAFRKKDQNQLRWYRNLNEGAVFEVPAGLPLYHGVAPGYADHFSELAKHHRAREWPFFTSATTDLDTALRFTGGDLSRVYQLTAPNRGLLAIPVAFDANPKGNEYEIILSRTHFQGRGPGQVEISPFGSGYPGQRHLRAAGRVGKGTLSLLGIMALESYLAEAAYAEDSYYRNEALIGAADVAAGYVLPLPVHGIREYPDLMNKYSHGVPTVGSTTSMPVLDLVIPKNMQDEFKDNPCNQPAIQSAQIISGQRSMGSLERLFNSLDYLMRGITGTPF